jgi:hypothetical protein
VGGLRKDLRTFFHPSIRHKKIKLIGVGKEFSFPTFCCMGIFGIALVVL